MKTIVITGGSSGIGRATALNLANLGHHVIAIGRNTERLATLKNENKNIETISSDIATEAGRADVKSFIKNTRIDILINNAGLMAPSGNLLNIELAPWRYQMAVNVEAPLFLTTQLIENLSHGRVLNVTIYSSYKVNPYFFSAASAAQVLKAWVGLSAQESWMQHFSSKKRSQRQRLPWATAFARSN